MSDPVVRRASRPRPLTKREIHVARRFSAGLNPALAADIRRAGSGRAWFLQQLRPASVPDPAGNAVDDWFPSLRRSPAELFQRSVDDVQGVWEVMADLSRWTVARRLRSRRQLYEVMVDFWSNLLHVPLGDDEAQFYRVSYDKVIRTHALGTFEALLTAAITHPAMGLSLDNATSSKEAPNENLGRELLELHTVGVDGGYTEADVIDSSRLLTGYRVDIWWPSFRSFYDTSRHWTGPVEILGFRHANRDADGRAATHAYLRYLARHPKTAQRIAHRLCQRFVSDTPPQGVVNAVAKAYLAHDTSIRPTLLALFEHPDFWASKGRKIRTPMEDWLATARALRIKVAAPVNGQSFANAMLWQYSELGAPPYEWPSPDGYPEAGAAWTSAGRVLGSLDLHRSLAAAWWPTQQATFRKPSAWLPPLPATLGTIVDHLGRELFGQPLPDAVRAGVAMSLGMPLDRRLTADELWPWRVQTLLASLLDSPVHLYR